MQVLELSDSKKPSAKLQDKIRTCASAFRSLSEIVNEVIQLGQSEGFTRLEIGHFIRIEMLKAGLHRSTVARYLPSELKHKPRGKQTNQTQQTQVSRNLRQNQIQTITFQGHIIKQSRDRRSIMIPSKFDVSKFQGKELDITLKIRGIV